MIQPLPGPPPGGVGLALKIVVGVLTLLILIGGVVLIGKIVQRLTGSAPAADTAKTIHRESRFLPLAEKLEAAGLPGKAIEQYARFLDRDDVKPRVRAEVALKIAGLYRRLDNCRDALVWLYQVELADEIFYRNRNVQSEIDFCLTHLPPISPTAD